MAKAIPGPWLQSCSVDTLEGFALFENYYDENIIIIKKIF